MRVLDTVCGPAYSLPRLSGLLSHLEGGLVRCIEFRDRVGKEKEIAAIPDWSEALRPQFMERAGS